MFRKFSIISQNRLLGLAIGCGVIALICDSIFGLTEHFLLTQIFGTVVFLVASSGKILEKQKHLKTKGLTPGDIRNIDFVKNWDVSRKTGMIKYCLVDGGLMAGMILFIPLSAVLFFVIGIDNVLANFRNLFAVSSAAITIAYTFGIMLYYLRWRTNERRFIRLTDPLQRFR